MPDKHLFEYAVIRIVPRVEREEFVNAGIILYCRSQKFLGCLHQVNHQKLKAICAKLDCRDVESHLTSFVAICEGKKGDSPISSLDAPSRFRWLTATRSTVVQTSKVHPGFCASPGATLQKLFEDFVL